MTIWAWESAAMGTAPVLQNGRWASRCLRGTGRTEAAQCGRWRRAPSPSSVLPQQPYLLEHPQIGLILEKPLSLLLFQDCQS